jgi:hypothetical protein
MTKEELGRFGRAVRNLYSLETSRDKTPREEVVIQLEEAWAEWMRRFTPPRKRRGRQQRVSEEEMPPVAEESLFHIFSGADSEDALWVEAVRGLVRARERLDEIATRNPGRYLLFSFASRAILAKTDTASNLMDGDMLGRDVA